MHGYFVTAAKVLQLQANRCYPVQQHITHVYLITAMVTYFATVIFTSYFFFLVGKTVKILYLLYLYIFYPNNSFGLTVSFIVC